MLSESDRSTDKEKLNRRFEDMKFARTPYDEHYEDLSEFIDPRRGRQNASNSDSGKGNYKKIINNTATMALRDSGAGLLAGMMSPSRPWFDLDTLGSSVRTDYPSTLWLDDLVKVCLAVYSQSNLYNMAPLMLREVLLFATACMTHVDDYEDIARFYTHTAGSYWIAANSRGNIDSLSRELEMTVYQMVQKFGLNNVSLAVRNMWDNGQYNERRIVRHLIELNPFRDESVARYSSEAARYRGVYWENASQEDRRSADFLERRGFKGFPAYVPRWELTNDDIYGTNSPAMICLGDVKTLQSYEIDRAKVMAKIHNPPIQGPASFKNTPVNTVPGGMTINTSTGAELKPIYQVPPGTQDMTGAIGEVERRIERGFYKDLFTAITDMEGIQPKNQLQLAQINEERLLLIGPVLEQLQGEWLSRMVGRTIQQILDAGIMRPAPAKLQGRELEIRYISALATAQKAVDIGNMERTVGFVGVLNETGFDVTPMIDPDFAVAEHARLNGTPPRMIRDVADAMRIRAEKAQAQQQAQLLEQVGNLAGAAKTASEIDLEGDNAVTRAAGGGSG